MTEQSPSKRKRGRPRKHIFDVQGERVSVPVDSKELSVRLTVHKLYFEDHQSVGQIADALHLSRMKVYSEITQTGKTLQVQIDTQIASIVVDSVSALSAMADEIRVSAEHPTKDYRERAATVQMYATMYDRVFPLITEYWKRNMPQMPILPPSVPLRQEGEYSNGTSEPTTGGEPQPPDTGHNES